MDKVASLKTREPLSKIPAKTPTDVRYVTFNVNGINTLFNYHPWNQLQGSVDAFLAAFDADIFSLQELKARLDAFPQLGLTEKYKAFVLVPKSKKGYSGVGLYVRIPAPDDPRGAALTVVKAEEGVTGRLRSTRDGPPYCNLESAIGGYLSTEDLSEMDLTEDDLVALDSEGRCVVVELANNTVVFSLYCPANSLGSEEGQAFRLRFLEVLFERASKLKALGKAVVIMGDMNVSPDLIDSAEGINELIKQKVVTNNLRDGGLEFEAKNTAACLAFRHSTEHRILFHRYAHPSFDGAPKLPTQFLHDSTRLHQGRKLALYTVWNTQTNARQSNYGSRIDLILLSSDLDAALVSQSGHLPFLFGSDHCPVFTDLRAKAEPHTFGTTKLAFEAKNFYKLVKHRDISALFASAKRSATPSASPSKQPKLDEPKKVTYVTRKGSKEPSAQQPIQNFFFLAAKNPNAPPQPPVERKPNASDVNVISQFASLVYKKPPNCHHKEPCELKTSMTKESRGRKFWCCARASKGSTTELGEHRCNYFEWSTKPV